MGLRFSIGELSIEGRRKVELTGSNTAF